MPSPYAAFADAVYYDAACYTPPIDAFDFDIFSLMPCRFRCFFAYFRFALIRVMP